MYYDYYSHLNVPKIDLHPVFMAGQLYEWCNNGNAHSDLALCMYVAHKHIVVQIGDWEILSAVNDDVI